MTEEEIVDQVRARLRGGIIGHVISNDHRIPSRRIIISGWIADVQPGGDYHAITVDQNNKIYPGETVAIDNKGYVIATVRGDGVYYHAELRYSISFLKENT